MGTGDNARDDALPGRTSDSDAEGTYKRAAGGSKFVQIAMSTHEEGMVQTKRLLKRLCHGGSRAAGAGFPRQLVAQPIVGERDGDPVSNGLACGGRAGSGEGEVRDCGISRSDCRGTNVEGMPLELILNWDEVRVGVKQRGKLISVRGCRLFGLRCKKLPYFTVFPVCNRFVAGPPFFVVVPRLASAQTRFQSLDRRKLYVANSHSGWVTGQILDEWAE
jgi:hypothetical protein